MTKSILFCYAHPDDELGVVPLVTRYAAEAGAYTTLICTTDGDVGTVDPEFLKNYASITELRLAELDAATKAAGFSEVVAFGYRDSGMMGSADNEHPDCSWQAPLEEVTQRVVEVMRRVRPQVVVTFNTFGAYGHPDHIKINQATLAAFQQLQSEPDHPQKLYYTTGPKALFSLMVTLMRLRGKDPRKAGRNHDTDLVAALDATDAATTKVAVARYLAPSWKAMDCYPSQVQMPPLVRRFRKILGSLLQGSVALVRVYPEPRLGDKLERDLFADTTDVAVHHGVPEEPSKK
ncbi:MAG TPA: PIG-L family deacetylase [Ktedonobacteraceae bacterium]|nr:PIG-L family deacetylase [Ktedonobacteraceae bacterium]